MEDKHSRNCSAEAGWPAASILIYGTFGMRGPAARRYHFRTASALAVMVLCILLRVLFRSSAVQSALDVVAAIAPGVTFVYIGWEFRRYLFALDELARRIQLEAIAWTYLCGLAIAMLLGGLGLAYHWQLSALWFIALEPLRAVWLFIISRRYQ